MVESTTEAHYRDLLAAVRSLIACDAVALLRLLPETGAEPVLQPLAVDGLADEALGRRFAASAHPRLARLLASGPLGLRFSSDLGLPDPYDGLLADQQELEAVHDCMGLPLHHAGRLWGLVTLDALDPQAFDAVEPARLQAVQRLLETGIKAQEALQAMAANAAQAQAAAQEQWQSVRSRELLGKSAAMSQLKREIDTVAASDLTVLILGETGVGKELVAQRLHARSARHARPLVQINCAALPETLADSELFGHKRGAFTGAVADRVGKFELADGGTLFLDEVGELPLAVQAKLLRALQSGELQRPGSDRLQRVDVRVLAATNRDLGQEVARGRFRADLYHRLSVYPLRVPALRERGRDVLTLAGGFLEENQHRLGARNLRLAPAAAAALLAQPWPGNVRELEHLISRAALRAWAEPGKSGRWTAIELRHLGLEAPTAPATTVAAAVDLPPVAPGLGLREATDAFQRQWIEAALQRHGGSLAGAAREAGMDRSNLLRLAKRLGLRAPSTSNG
ncbi:nitric oxide reductase transcriptional regulator NorR [Roseateles asaccharophilus]|uniref:Anaerobic nitric oxide reductase transcription regulator n=1 Tax=Roseateles asaccharophilus TaxID=582607 RepID=A0ABU2A4T2_9BURK|nr:nitric oxide reductase transcriptional regulator NorR [Roseateles asaccharophilus]MDR7332161.1 anaerobic nitric oxide reductase transcription regulator [Roseateles asaccharophilus]